MTRRSKKKATTGTATAKTATKPPGSSAAAPSPYATVGRDLGGLLGFGDLGDRVGGAIGRLFGRGDYEIRTNSLMANYGLPAAGPSPALLFEDGKRGTRVVEREFLGDIKSGTLSGASTIFTNQAFRINPSDPTTFPWLSRLASNFDQWKPNGIVFEFRSTSSEFNGTTQALGAVILATDYDVYDNEYGSKAEAENADYSMSVKASDTAIHGIECAIDERPTKVLFCSSTTPTSGDRRMYDLGVFQLCSQGMSAADVTLGELWVSYDITFYKKQISQLPLASEVYGTGTTGVSTTNYFGTDTALYKTPAAANVAVTSNTINFDPTVTAYYFVECAWTATTVANPFFTPTGCSVVSTGLPPAYSQTGTSGSVVMVYRLVVSVPGTQASSYVTLSAGTITGGSRASLWIHVIDDPTNFAQYV